MDYLNERHGLVPGFANLVARKTKRLVRGLVLRQEVICNIKPWVGFGGTDLDWQNCLKFTGPSKQTWRLK